MRKNHGKRALFFACNRHTSLFRCRGPGHMLHRAGASEPLPDGICVGSQARVCADYRRILCMKVHPLTMPEQRHCCRSWTSSIIRKLIPHWETMISARTSTVLFGDWPLISPWTIVYRTNGSDGSYWIPPAARSLANCPGSQLAWLEQELSKPTDSPTILALHHPVYGTTTAETDANNLATRTA